MKAHHWTLLLLLLLCAVPIGAQQRCVTVTPAKQTQQVGYVAPTTLIPAQGPTYSTTDDLLLQILTELKGLRQDVQGLKNGQQPAQDGALGIIAAKCLGCHQDGKAKDKGGDFVLVEKDNSLAELSLAEKRRIIKMVETGKMPPSGKLPDNEVKVLSEFFAPKEEKPK